MNTRLLQTPAGASRTIYLLLMCLLVVRCGTPAADWSTDNVYYQAANPSEEQDLLDVPNGATWIVSNGFAMDFDYLDQEIFHFSIDTYLADQSPHLLPYREVISHFTTLKGISPRLLLALMEEQSKALSNPHFTETKPLGELSAKSGFLEQTRDVCIRLRAIATPEGASPEENWPQEAISTLLSGEDLFRLSSVYQNLFPGVNSQRVLLAFGKNRQMIDLQFPFSRDETWQNWWGGHSDSGSGSVHNSLDFADGVEGSHAPRWGAPINVYVVASAPGTAQVGSSCYLKIKHTDGWSTTYYHMDHIMVKTGDIIEANQPVGKYADNLSQAICSGGGSGAEHVHWGIWKNNSPVSLQDKVVSGWTINLGPTNYYDKCDKFYFLRDGKKVCASYNLDNSGAQNNQPPKIAITAPQAGMEVEIGKNGKAEVLSTVKILEEPSQVKQVTLLLGANPYGDTLKQPPFEWNIDLAPGTYTLGAKAIDVQGNTGKADNITISVADRIPPTVVITQPSSGNAQNLAENEELTVVVKAQDMGVGLAKVTLQVDGVQQGEPLASEPFRWTLTLPIGSYRINATATDKASNVANSAKINVTVGTEPDTNLMPLFGCGQSAICNKDSRTLGFVLFICFAYQFIVVQNRNSRKKRHNKNGHSPMP